MMFMCVNCARTSYFTCLPLVDSQGTNTKVYDLMMKSYLEAIALVVQVYSFYLQEEKIFKSSKL